MSQQILEIKADHDDIISAVKEWANCHEVEISETGEIWINNPQRGHWLNDDDKARFVAWCYAQ